MSPRIGDMPAAAAGQTAGWRGLSEPEAVPLTRFAMADPQSFPAGMSSGVAGFLAHGIAPPAEFRAAVAARLGVTPEWQSACSSTPPIPKKPGWWY